MHTLAILKKGYEMHYKHLCTCDSQKVGTLTIISHHFTYKIEGEGPPTSFQPEERGHIVDAVS